MTWATWLLAFSGTLIIEVPTYALATRSVFGLGRAIAVGVLLNVATHPLLWVVLWQLRNPFPLPFLIAETIVWAMEAGLLKAATHARIAQRPLELRVALAISLAANGFSAGAGLLL